MTAHTPTVAKIDFRKTHPDLYRATAKVVPIRVSRGTFLARDGVGTPGGAEFQEAIGQMYSLAYTAKFSMKKAGGGDFAVPALECLWLDDPSSKPKEEWRWRLMLRIPDHVSSRDLEAVRKALMDRKSLDTSAVKRVAWTEGTALQTLHVGPYDTVGETYKRVFAAAAGTGYACVGIGHEVYLSDPRRVAPARLKTIVRVAVKKATKA
jgi:hypothetical protein